MSLHYFYPYMHKMRKYYKKNVSIKTMIPCISIHERGKTGQLTDQINRTFAPNGLGPFIKVNGSIYEWILAARKNQIQLQYVFTQTLNYGQNVAQG